MLGEKKRYIGTYSTPEEAARAFDKYALVYRGLKVHVGLAIGVRILGKNELRVQEERAEETF